MRDGRAALVVLFLATPLLAAGGPRLVRATGSVVHRSFLGDGERRARAGLELDAGSETRTLAGARAELRSAGAAIYLAPSTTLRAVAVGSRGTRLAIDRGVASFRVVTGESIEVELPNGSVTLDGPVLARVDVQDPALSKVTVHEGRAYVAVARGEIPVSAGDAIAIAGDASPRYDATLRAARDAWDDWVDRALRRK